MNGKYSISIVPNNKWNWEKATGNSLSQIEKDDLECGNLLIKKTHCKVKIYKKIDGELHSLSVAGLFPENELKKLIQQVVFIDLVLIKDPNNPLPVNQLVLEEA